MWVHSTTLSRRLGHTFSPFVLDPKPLVTAAKATQSLVFFFVHEDLHRNIDYASLQNITWTCTSSLLTAPALFPFVPTSLFIDLSSCVNQSNVVRYTMSWPPKLLSMILDNFHRSSHRHIHVRVSYTCDNSLSLCV